MGELTINDRPAEEFPHWFEEDVPRSDLLEAALAGQRRTLAANASVENFRKLAGMVLVGVTAFALLRWHQRSSAS